MSAAAHLSDDDLAARARVLLDARDGAYLAWGHADDAAAATLEDLMDDTLDEAEAPFPGDNVLDRLTGWASRHPAGALAVPPASELGA